MYSVHNKIISLQITELKHDVISVKIFNMKCLLLNPERYLTEFYLLRVAKRVLILVYHMFQTIERF